MKIQVKTADASPQVIVLQDNATMKDLLEAIKANHPFAIRNGKDTLGDIEGSLAKRLSELGIRHMDTLFLDRSMPKLAGGGEYRQDKDGQPLMVIRKIDDDNSCLFNAVAYVMARQPRETAGELRAIVAGTILSDPQTYDRALLEQSTEDYVRWILLPSSWGGAIELGILADYYECQIASIDVKTGKLYVFGSEKWTAERAYILYSGIHYDAVALSPGPSYPSRLDSTRFDPRDEFIEMQAKSLADEARRRHQYTDTATFTLRCGECGMLLAGERDAAKHAMQSGHSKFSEYE